ncbi:hypothetical protein GCM10007938_34830 [Vibrio zhanjiangensis]|uniref:Uncharacterized protein n=1 Tax=Vibrio zhanjiangensis TaxID=1046128 RepID=A0ABQ6F575_9VIBR|nr:hypothetical protein [Vibrio zhanjiangensis]GLT19700.1 hypothetical protein GCM10007938_34830 [Vibrio zhanjiangensis]
MNKDVFYRNFLSRLLIEQNYSLLIDANRSSSQIPNQEYWQEKLENSSDETFEQEALEYIGACQKHLESLPIFGGPYEDDVVYQAGEVAWEPDKIVIPSLLVLKNYASRVLVKATPISSHVLLLTETHQCHPDREWLTKLCDDVRREVLAAYELEKSQLHSVVVTTVIVGSSDVNLYRLAKKNSNRVSLNRNFLRYIYVDIDKEKTWSPTFIHTLAERRMIKAIFSSGEKSTESLFADFISQDFSWKRVVFSGVAAFAFTLLVNVFIARFDLSLLFTLSHALVPMIVFSTVFGSMRNKTRVYKQVIYGAVINLVLMTGLYFLITFPSDGGEWLGLVKLITITTVPSLLAGRIIEITS